MVSSPDEIRLAILKGEMKYVSNEEEEREAILKANQCYDEIVSLMKFYHDMPEETVELVALWIMGSYLHDEFNSYPFLFINAMRGSGKSRLLNFIAHTAWNGKMTNNITESVLFRTAKRHTLVIDEVESIIKKDKASLRELLNSAYKKGAAVERMKKIRHKDGEDLIVEKFELYTPIAMANIQGMDEVTGDRCIPIILEKSGDLGKIKLMEDFEDEAFLDIKRTLESIQCTWCSVVSSRNIKKGWNKYISMKYNNYTNPLTTLSTLETLDTLTRENLETFTKIDELNIDGRNLELFFPLIIISKTLGDDKFEKILKIAQSQAHQKMRFEQEDSPDISIYRFIARKESLDWYNNKQLLSEFKLFYNTDDSDRDWLNVHWFSRSLRRLKLVSLSRRLGTGTEFMLDVAKAIEKSKLFEERELGVKNE